MSKKFVIQDCPQNLEVVPTLINKQFNSWAEIARKLQDGQKVVIRVFDSWGSENMDGVLLGWGECERTGEGYSYSRHLQREY